MTKPKADPSILEAFWALSEGNDTQRIQSVVKITKILDEKQSEQTGGMSTDLEYVLMRLFRGLASDRKLARHGFAVALTQVLRRYEQITMDHIFSLIKDNLKISSAERKSEKANIALGQVIAYTTCYQSGKLQMASGKEVARVVNELITWSQQKPALGLLCMQAVSQIVSKVSPKTFTKHIWKSLNPLLSDGWKNCTPDILLLLINVMKYQNAVDEDYLKTHWGSTSIVCSKNFEKICEIMMSSTEDHPVIHSVCSEVVDEAMKDTQLLKQFWSKVVNDKLMTSQAAKRYLGFHLVTHGLNQATSVEQVEIILSHNVVDCLVRNLSDEKLLHAASKQVLAEISKYVETCGNGQIQMAVMLALLRDPGSIQFDSVTRTHTITNMMSLLLPKGAESMAKLLMDIMTGKPLLGGLDVSDMIVTRKWALPHLRNLVTVNSMSTNTDWQLGILQFLFIHAFFEVKENDSSIPHCQKLKQSFDVSTHSLIQEAFFRALDNLAVYQHQDENSDKRTQKDPRLYIEMMYQVLLYAKLLLSKPDAVELKLTMKSQAKEQWNIVVEKVEKIREKVTTSSDMGHGHAFQMLFLQLGLQLFTDSKNAVDVIKELSVCHEKAFQKKRRMSLKNADLDEPHWVDVVTELLLSMLSQPSHLMRVVVGRVFSMLIPLLTDQSVQLILDVINPSGNEEEEGPLAFQDEEEEDEEMEEESTNGKEESEEEENESSESSDESEADEDGEVDENFRSSIKAALGDAADKSDDEESDSDMSDSAMEKIDHVLSEAFRSMLKGKAGKKDEIVKQQQLRHYKMRCLDLLDILVKQNTPVSKLINLLMPLLDLMESGLKDKSQKEISDRATNILHNLFKSKKAYIDISLEKSLLPDLIKELIQLSTKDSGIPLMKDITSAILFVVRVLLGMEHDCGPSPAKTRSRGVEDSKEVKQMKEQAAYVEQVLAVIKETMVVYFEKRDSHFNHLLLQEILKRQPNLLWSLTSDLLDYATKPEIRVFCKTQACVMIRNMMSKNTPNEIGKEKWNTFLEKTKTEISKALLGMSKEDIRPKYLQELLTLLLRSVDLNGRKYQLQLSQEVIENVRTLQGGLKNEARKTVNRFLAQTDKSDGNQRKRPAGEENGSSKSKKKKKKQRESNDSGEQTSAAEPLKEKQHSSNVSQMSDDSAEEDTAEHVKSQVKANGGEVKRADEESDSSSLSGKDSEEQHFTQLKTKSSQKKKSKSEAKVDTSAADEKTPSKTASPSKQKHKKQKKTPKSRS